MLQLINNPFPFFLNDNRKNILLILATSIFVTLFLTLYTPFENPNNTIINNIQWGFFCFLALYANLILIPKLFPALFELTRWTLLKYILFNAWLFLTLGILFTVINSLLFKCDINFISLFIKTQREVVLTGLIPLIVITILAKNNLLKQNLADAFEINKKLSEIQTIKEQPKQLDHKTTIQTDTNETFSLNLTDLVYILAMDNYSEIYWNDNGKITKKLLRVTLKNVESQLTNQFIVRCHRSYLINVQAIESISGNTNGYKLQMKNTEVEIPVSRAKGKEIIAHIQQIRDLLDIM
jgi:hypothetical protein